jgi:hypothetical protein
VADAGSKNITMALCMLNTKNVEKNFAKFSPLLAPVKPPKFHTYWYSRTYISEVVEILQILS